MSRGSPQAVPPQANIPNQLVRDARRPSRRAPPARPQQSERALEPASALLWAAHGAPRRIGHSMARPLADNSATEIVDIYSNVDHAIGRTGAASVYPNPTVPDPPTTAAMPHCRASTGGRPALWKASRRNAASEAEATLWQAYPEQLGADCRNRWSVQRSARNRCY
jgi:hypothetical protein